MSAVPNARKNVQVPTTKLTTKKSGQAKRGEKPGMNFSSPTRSVPIVNPRLEFRITHTSKSTDDLNISNSLRPLPYVSLVIEGSMLSGSNALTAARLAVNPKVTSAILACLEMIENELSTAESTGSDNSTVSTPIKESQLTHGKKNTPEHGRFRMPDNIEELESIQREDRGDRVRQDKLDEDTAPPGLYYENQREKMHP